MFQDFASECHHFVLGVFECHLILQFTGISELFYGFLLPHRITIKSADLIWEYNGMGSASPVFWGAEVYPSSVKTKSVMLLLCAAM